MNQEPFTVSDDELENLFRAQEIRASAQAVANLAPLFEMLGTMRAGFMEVGFSPEAAEKLTVATYLNSLGR